MTLHEYLRMIERREPIVAGSPAHEIMHHAYEESQRIKSEKSKLRGFLNSL